MMKTPPSSTVPPVRGRTTVDSAQLWIMVKVSLAFLPTKNSEMPRWAAERLHPPGSDRGRPNVLCSHYSTLKKIVAHSDCVSGGLEPNIAAELAAGWFVRVPVTGLKLRSNPGIVALKNRALSPAARALMEEIQQGAQQLRSASLRG